MNSTTPLTLAVWLAMLAGFVDALGFLRLSGVFVSFMSGNSTELGVEMGSGGFGRATLPAASIALFVAGVVAGNLVHAGAQARSMRVLMLVTGLLLSGALLQEFGLQLAAAGTLALAMGAENTVFERSGSARIGLTYMTGTLVRVGDHLAAALRGGPPFAWLKDGALWGGLVLGAFLGSLSYQTIGLGSLWLATAGAGCLTVVVRRHPLPR